MEEWTWFSLTRLLSTTCTSFIPYMWARIQFSISYQDWTRATNGMLAEGTAQSGVQSRGGHSCPLIIMLGLKLRKVCPGIHGPLRKGGFNPTNRPKKTPNPWSTCQHTFKTWPCVLLQASDLQATSVYMSNRNNPDGDLTLLYFLMNQIFKWVDWKDRWENLSQSKALTRVTTLSGAAWWSLLIKNCLCFSW